MTAAAWPLQDLQDTTCRNLHLGRSSAGLEYDIQQTEELCGAFSYVTTLKFCPVWSPYNCQI